MNFYSSWGSTLPPTAFPVALFCAVCGTAVLSIYTRRLGLPLMLINTTVLFIGAYVANVLTADLSVPLERFYVKPIVMSFAGMSFSSMLLLLFFSRSNDTP